MTLNKLCQHADLDGTGELSRIVSVSAQTLINWFNSKGAKRDKYKLVVALIIGASEIKRMEKARAKYLEEAESIGEEMRLHQEKIGNLFLMQNKIED